MCEYIIVATDQDGNFIERATVSSSSQFAAHNEAKMVGEKMIQNGAYNVVLSTGGKDVGFLPGWAAAPHECWSEEHCAQVLGRARAIGEGISTMCSDKKLPQA